MPAGIFGSDLTAATTVVQGAFLKGFSEAQNNLPWKQITTDLGKSGSKIRALDFLGAPPEMRDVTQGSLIRDGLGRFSHSMTHRVYKMAIPVRISDLDTDQSGVIRPRLEGAGRKAAGHPGRLAVAQFEANPTAFDGTAVFANTRAWGAAANFDNLLGGTGVEPADIEADIASARTVIMNAQDDTGQEMELSMNVLVIPPALSLAFAKVLGPVRTAGGVDGQLAVVPPSQGNSWQGGGYTVIELASLSDQNNWYGLSVGNDFNPFLYSWVREPVLMNSPSMNDTSATEHDELVYVFRGEYGVSVSLPQYFVSVVN